MFAQVLANGGPVLWILAVLSLIAGTVIIERVWRLMPLRKRFLATRDECERRLRDGGRDAALAGLVGDDPMSRSLARGLAVADGGSEAVREHALDAAQREVPGIERGLGILATVSHVAPLLGLLGTVTGLMRAFRAASLADVLTHDVLAEGIYQALGTTALGLAVAIPCYLAHSSLAGIATRLIDQLELAASELALWSRRR